jgi:hypothetical protein
MSTLTGPNLTPGRVQVEKLMDDTCMIVRNPLGERDGVYDATTRVMAPSATSIIYDDSSVGTGAYGARAHNGKCKVSSLRDSQPRTLEIADTTIDSRIYRFGIPLDTPEIAIGDRIYIMSSRRSPIMVGHFFIVMEVTDSTFAMSNRCVVERRVWRGSGDTEPSATPGPSAGPFFGEFVAGETLAAGRIVRLDASNEVVLYDPSDVAEYDEIFGITASAAGAGTLIRVATGVLTSGPLTLPAWGLTPGALYFAGLGGVLTSTPPTTAGGYALLTPLGVASTADTFVINIGQTVIL